MTGRWPGKPLIKKSTVAVPDIIRKRIQIGYPIVLRALIDLLIPIRVKIFWKPGGESGFLGRS